ncbi:hypothetical protein [uncultured Sulfitobacter sp.]|uniref:hypothetical protein n=1 Tax=uncultured Sulfitobacter sp. TaxID=191468 RepID=UPI002608D099|nr:hypothetical protein [uncultured Sulfitobacter sp.]
MRAAARILLLTIAACAGLALAAIVLFSGPTLYGLRPHAVRDGLDVYDTDALLALAENGPSTGVLTYDSWYEGRDGKTGWFLLARGAGLSPEFAVRGVLDPSIAKIFGSNPRRCAGTPFPIKMIRVIEPERDRSGFLGRSTCKRADMDLADVIAASRPALRQKETMTHAELLAFDTASDPLRLRDDVRYWPTPYAYHRTLALPLVWQTYPNDEADKLYALTQAAQEWARNLHSEGVVGIQVRSEEWRPRTLENFETDQMAIRMDQETLLISGIKVRRIAFVVLCAPLHREACDAIDPAPLLTDVAALRDPAVLARALATQQPMPNDLIWGRDILRHAAFARSTITAPTASERQFSVTWYTASDPQ